MSGYRRKLIEVALPLDAINAAASREKSLRHGHPSTLHLWWARRPLAAARAVLWASLVDDPSCDPSLSEAEQDRERQRLFAILERLVLWENSNNPDVLAEARAEIERCFPEGAPSVLDPFAGGGSIPLEAQRLGLEALSGDLNPVAVLIQKAMLEIPPRFAGRAPVHPHPNSELKVYERAQGLATDVEAYGQWMHEQAQRRIGHLYPDVDGPTGKKLTPVAWIWARTVRSPDPSWGEHVPLIKSWVLSRKPKQPPTWVEPRIDHEARRIDYAIRTDGKPPAPTVVRGQGRCLGTGAAIPVEYVRSEGRACRLKAQLLAVVALGEPRGKVFVAASPEQVSAAEVDHSGWRPESRLPDNSQAFGPPLYGMQEWWMLFTSRQLVALTCFSDLLSEVWEQARTDALRAGFTADGVRLRGGGSGAAAYADAVVTYLAFVVDRCADRCSTICTWDTIEKVRNTFPSHRIGMTWDFAETNPFSGSTGSWDLQLGLVRKALLHLPAAGVAQVIQADARKGLDDRTGPVMISTDPPYYDNIGYADVSDFFYVWLRHNLEEIWPTECATLLVPKADELIANRFRAGSPEAAKEHFESGMAEFMEALAKTQAPNVPASIFYAYKATEATNGETRSTGWATFLQAVIDGGLQVTATWPLRTELANRPIAIGTNALASSMVLVCRPRTAKATPATRGELLMALRNELPAALQKLQTTNIAPVDLAQATIGPGMQIYSRYSKIFEADGSTMPVTDALAIINEILGEILDGSEADLDPETRFAVTWYSQHGYNAASSGDADALARAKDTSLTGITAAGIGEAREGGFRLLHRNELDEHPTPDAGVTVWQAMQYLMTALERSENDAAELLKRLGERGEPVRQLAYVMFKKTTEKANNKTTEKANNPAKSAGSDNNAGATTDANAITNRGSIGHRSGVPSWAGEAVRYNELIGLWPSLRAMGSRGGEQRSLL